MSARAVARHRGHGSAVLPALLVVGFSLAFVPGCSGGREARLQEVLRRSRAAPETISSLEKPFLEDPEPDVRALAVWAIGEAHAPDALEVLSPLAKDTEAVVRLSVVRALCPTSPTTTPEAVLALVKDPDTETRRAAVRCVAGKSEPAPGVLALALGDGDRDIRVYAMEALTRRPERDAMEALLAAVTARRPEEQLAAVAALRALHDPAAVPALEKAAAERLSPAVRDAVEAAIIDLRRVGEEPLGDGTSSAKPAAPARPASGRIKKASPPPAPEATRDPSADAGADAATEETGEATVNEPPVPPSPSPQPPRRRQKK